MKMTDHQNEMPIYDMPPADFIKAVGEGLNFLTEREDLDKRQLADALRFFIQETHVKIVAEDLFEHYYERNSKEHLDLYRKLYRVVESHNVICDERIAPFFKSIPLKLIEASEDEIHPAILEITSHIEFEGVNKPIEEIMPLLTKAHYVNSYLVDYFNDLPRLTEVAKRENISISERFNKDIRWATKKKDIEQHEAYEGFDGFEALPLDVAKKFVRKLEDLVKDLEDQDIYKRDAAPIVLALLEQGNYKLLVNHLFMCLDRTNDVKYYKLFRRIYDCIEWVDCEEEAFAPFDWEPVYNIFKGKADIHTAILKEEVTTELEFDGKTISIEEYMQLAQKVNKMNNMLLGSLLVNNETRYAVATGTGTPTEIFAKKIEMRNQVNNRSKK